MDVGTTGTKVKLFSSNGSASRQSWTEHPTNSYPGGGAVEQNPEVWWSAVKASLRTVTRKKGAIRIKAIGITGLALTTVLLGKDGRTLREAMLYSDTRHRQHGAELAAIVREPGYGTLKHIGDVLWTMKNEGLSAGDVSIATDALGFVCFKLTGKAAFDSYLMPESQVNKLGSELGLPSGCFGVPHGNTDVVGEVSAKAAKETGLPKGLPVVVGPWDGMCNILGSGLTEAGIAADVAGSTEILAVTTAQKPSIMNLPHIVPGLYFTYSSPPLGTLHRSFASDFFASDRRESPYTMLEKEARRSSPGSNGLLFVPCDPSGKPGRDPTASFVGVTPKHLKSHFARAVLEGIAFSIRRSFDSVEEAGVAIKEVRVSGGGSKSDFWTQIRADVTGRRFVKMEELETGCLGAAMLAGIGTGVYADIRDATRRTVRQAKVFVPDATKHQAYDGQFTEFVRASEKLC
jgi:xylulokinase